MELFYAKYANVSFNANHECAAGSLLVKNVEFAGNERTFLSSDEF